MAAPILAQTYQQIAPTTKPLSLEQSVIVVNASYVKSRFPDHYRKDEHDFSIDPYNLCTIAKSTQTTSQRCEVLEKLGYKKDWIQGVSTILRVPPSPKNQNSYCTGAYVYLTEPQPLPVTVKSNITEASLRYQCVKREGETLLRMNNNLKPTPLHIFPFIFDDKNDESGLAGVLVPTMLLNSELIALAAAAPVVKGDLYVYQPGVVFCRLRDVIDMNEISDSPEEEVAVVSERHVFIPMLASDPRNLGIHHIYSFAWPVTVDDDGGTKAFVMKRAVYWGLTERARGLAKYLVDSLVPMGELELTVNPPSVKGTIVPPPPPLEATATTIPLQVVAEYIHFNQPSDLLYRDDHMSQGLFVSTKVSQWQCTRTAPGIFAKLMDTGGDLFETQRLFGRGIIAGSELKDTTTEERIAHYLNKKSNNTNIMPSNKAKIEVKTT